MNRHESIARDAKAQALVAQLERIAAEVGCELHEEFLADLDWRALALVAKVNPPSEMTIAVVRERIKRDRIVRRMVA